MKRIRIAQAERLDWKKELRRYVTKYRGIDHATTGKSPAELLFNRKIKGKLPELHADYRPDLEIRDRDAEVKAKTKAHADKFMNARLSDVQVGDEVLVRQEKKDKFSTPFNPSPFQVVSKTGNSVVIESQGGTQYSRNTSHVKKFVSETPMSVIKAPSAVPGESAVGDTSSVPTTIPSQASYKLTPVAPATPSIPLTRIAPLTRASVKNENEAVPLHKDVVVDQATVPSTPARPRYERPQRQRTLPQKYKDFVTE